MSRKTGYPPALDQARTVTLFADLATGDALSARSAHAHPQHGIVRSLSDPQRAGVAGSHRSLRLINRPTRLEGTPPDRGGFVGEVVGSSVGLTEQPQHLGVRQ
jgi:hypothetical protein